MSFAPVVEFSRECYRPPQDPEKTIVKETNHSSLMGKTEGDFAQTCKAKSDPPARYQVTEHSVKKLTQSSVSSVKFHQV
jgi:hypothetical protein